MLEELQKDPWGVPTDQRATRCTGTALSIAAHVLGACIPGSGARIMAFVGGPSTEGPGAVSFLLSRLSSNLEFSVGLYLSCLLSGLFKEIL